MEKARSANSEPDPLSAYLSPGSFAGAFRRDKQKADTDESNA